MGHDLELWLLCLALKSNGLSWLVPGLAESRMERRHKIILESRGTTVHLQIQYLI